MANPLDSTNRALQDVNLDVSGGVQPKTVERVGEAQKDSSTGRTTMSYNVKMTMDNGTQRSFKITVGFSREQLAAHLSGQGEGSGKLEDTIDKIVNGMKAEDIMKAAGQRISARLDDLDNATVTKLQGGGQSQLRDLIGSSDTNVKTMAESISKVINAFSQSEVAKLFSSNVNPQSSSSGEHSPPEETANRGQKVDHLAELESMHNAMDAGKAPPDQNAFVDQLEDNLRGENSSGRTTDSSKELDDLDQLTADFGSNRNGAVQQQNQDVDSDARLAELDDTPGEATVQPQSQTGDPVDGSISPNPRGNDLETYTKEDMPPLPSTPRPKDFSLGEHRNRSASADSVSSRSETTADRQKTNPSTEARNRSGSTDRAIQLLGRGPSASDGTSDRLPESVEDRSLKNKGTPQSQIESHSGTVTGEDVTDLVQGSSNPTVHSVRTSLKLEFEVLEDTPTSTPSSQTSSTSTGETKSSEIKEQQTEAEKMNEKLGKLQTLDQKLTSKTSKSVLETIIGVKPKEYQEAVLTILEFEDAGITELTYKVVIPGQTLAEGEKPKTKPVTVGTTQLLGKFLQKSNGRKAIIKNNEIYEKLKNDSLQHIKQFAPELAVKLEKMPQKNEKQKVEFLKSLLEAREISTRYELVAAKLPVTAEGLKPVDTSSIALNYTHPKYADENAQDLVQDLDSQISSLTQQLQDNENKSETMDKIGECLCRKELIAQKGDFVKAKAALTQQLSTAEDSANKEQTEKLKSALKALPKVMDADVKQFRMLKNTLIEVFESEFRYCDGLVALTEKSYGSEDNKMTFYQLLHHDGLINDVELEILQSHTEDCLKESARLICELAGLPYNEDVSSSANILDAQNKFQRLSTEDQLGKVLNGFRPERLNQAMKPMTAMILKQSQTEQIISRVGSDKNGGNRLEEFSKVPKNNGLQLSAFVATPFQRALKYPSFHDNLAKFAPSSASDQIAINMQQLRNNFEIVNSIAPRT